jgi:class 3 adenylate cyclase
MTSAPLPCNVACGEEAITEEAVTAQVERRLAAILAADVVAYSRLMGADEEGTLARLKSLRHELIDPSINQHRGRIVKTTGDGMLVEFASVVDALRCAVEVQRGMAERNMEAPADRRIEFRVGINLGDVITDGEDIFGDGVNIAARLEGIAEAGGISLSASAYDQVRGKVDVAFADLGEQKLKNIARPVRVFRVLFSAPKTTLLSRFLPLQGQARRRGGSRRRARAPGRRRRGFLVVASSRPQRYENSGAIVAAAHGRRAPILDSERAAWGRLLR